MSRGRYAAGTEVSTDRSKTEIEKTLARYGADQFMYGWETSRAMIGFRASGKMVRLSLPLPDRHSDEFLLTPSRKWQRSAPPTYLSGIRYPMGRASRLKCMSP